MMTVNYLKQNHTQHNPCPSTSNIFDRIRKKTFNIFIKPQQNLNSQRNLDQKKKKSMRYYTL
jgi:hypothetical protein